LAIEFFLDLAPDITPEMAEQFLTIEPPVRNFRFEGGAVNSSHAAISNGV
jgi:hypothetical protein